MASFDKKKVVPNLGFKRIDPNIGEAELLSQEGWFKMADVFRVLDSDNNGKYKLAFKQVQRIIDRGEDPFEIMGHRKFGGRVGLLMQRFAPWYRANPIFHTLRLDKDMSFGDFLNQKRGYFRLSQVCRIYEKFIPYSYAMLKREADKREDPLREIGIMKYDTNYLVSMPRFEQWLREQLLC